jgi:purine-binding chemotaxis protein CheW
MTVDPLHIVAFEVGGQRFGLALSTIEKIERAVTIVPLPQAPAILEGAINVRGKVVAVLDIRQRFGLPAKAAEHTDHLVLAWAGPRHVALRVDRVVAIHTVSPDQVEPTDGLTAAAPYVAGVAKLADGLLLIHDLRAFLSQAEAQALDSAVGEAAP